jgi:hypothetical protein
MQICRQMKDSLFISSPLDKNWCQRLYEPLTPELTVKFPLQHSIVTKTFFDV